MTVEADYLRRKKAMLEANEFSQKLENGEPITKLKFWRYWTDEGMNKRCYYCDCLLNYFERYEYQQSFMGTYWQEGTECRNCLKILCFPCLFTPTEEDKKEEGYDPDTFEMSSCDHCGYAGEPPGYYTKGQEK